MRVISRPLNGGLTSALAIALISALLTGCMGSDGSPQTSPSALRETADIEARGQASYSPFETNSSAKVRINAPVRIIEESSPVLKPEVREFRLSPELERELQEKKQPMQGLFETTLEADEANGKIDIRFALRNISGKDLQITYGSGQKYDFWIHNEKDEEVYRWSFGKSFTQALIERELLNSEVIEFNEAWDLHDNEGNPVPPGQYTITVKVMIGLEEGTIRQDELTARYAVEI